MGQVANLWPLDQNKGPRFQNKSPGNFLTIAGDPDPCMHVPQLWIKTEMIPPLKFCL